MIILLVLTATVIAILVIRYNAGIEVDWNKSVEEVIPCGLLNTSGICYINASIQSLLSSENFNKQIEAGGQSDNKIIQGLLNIKDEMRSGALFDPLPYYKTMFSKDKKMSSFFNKGGCPSDTIAYIGWYMEKIIKKNFFFPKLISKKTEIIQLNFVGKGKKLLFAPDLVGSVPDMVKKGIEKYCHNRTFRFPRLFIIDLRTMRNKFTYSFSGDYCPLNLKIFDTNYRLVSIIISKEGKTADQSHVYSIGYRMGKWYKFNDHTVARIYDKRVVFNNTESFIAFYDKV